jgi:2-methylfumaryl-CoA hydratase
MKTNPGRYFEDFRLGEVITHAAPRTVSGGERALYQALYPARHALQSSDLFARACGLAGSPLEDWMVFHLILGKSVPDISVNAIANLGYAEGRWLRPAFAGDTLRAESRVIGLKENSNRQSGVVWVRTTGLNQRDEMVLTFARWVMVRKRDAEAEVGPAVVPELAASVAAVNLVVPEGLDFGGYDFALAGEAHRWGDYAVGERIDHLDGVTVEEADHLLATRLWQNTARVHFDVTAREDGRRLIYGGHVISLARGLSFNGLANAQCVVALNAGTHANPCFAGDTVRAWSEVLDKAVVGGLGALRLRTVAVRHGAEAIVSKGPDGRYLTDVLLDIDYWALTPM